MKTINKTKTIEDHFIQQGREFCLLRGELVDTEKMMRYQTGDRHPFFNGVMFSDLSHQELQKEIEFLKQDSLKKNLPLSWIVGPSSKPEGLKEMLLEQGFINPFYLTGMFARLDALDFSQAKNPNLEIKRVTTAKELEQWRDVLVKGMGDDDATPADFLQELFLKLGFEHLSPWQNYVGYCEGEPVCTSTQFIFEGVVSIYCVATLPEFRKRGFGAAITLAPLLDARSRRLTNAVLHSSEMAVTMYKQLGFSEECRLEGFLFNAG